MRLNLKAHRGRLGKVAGFAVAGVSAAALLVMLLPRSGGAESAEVADEVADDAAVSHSGANCDNYMFPVDVAATGGAGQQVFGQLCVKGRMTADTPVQVLLSGGTYDHSYWDWPYKPGKYSYVHQATRAGYATLNLDRLGYGLSSRPDPETLDFDAGAEAVSQVVEQLRDGAVGAQFDTVILNGHSMGGMVATRAAAHGGVDAVIVSGIPPQAGPDDEDDPETAPPDSDDMYPFYPAEEDPKFAAYPWAEGYLTTLPGTRDEAFLYPGTYEPGILETEEALKDTMTVAELQTVRPPSDSAAGESADAPAAADPDVPTAYVLGAHDSLACEESDCTTDPGAAEADYIVPDSGHSINVSHGAADFYGWTFEWLAKLPAAS